MYVYIHSSLLIINNLLCILIQIFNQICYLFIFLFVHLYKKKDICHSLITITKKIIIIQRMQLSDSDQIATTTGYDQNYAVETDKQKKQVTKVRDNKNDDQINENQLNTNIKQQHLQDEKQLNDHHSNRRNDAIVVVINDKNIITTTTHSNGVESGQQQQKQQKNDEKNQLQNNEEQNVKQLQEKLQTLVTFQSKQFQQEKDKIVHNQNAQQQQQRNQLTKDNSNTKPLQQPKTYNTQPQIITRFNPQQKSTTISLNQNKDQAQQSKYYFENCKLSLTQPITSIDSAITFRIDNLKYCVGVGVGLKEVIEKHGYDYKSTTTNQLGHGLYIVTTQGYSWSPSQTQEDDVFRGQQWKNLYTGANILVKLEGEILTFKFKKSFFTMNLPSRIREKYTLSFCAYLHEKTDAVSIIS